MDLVFLSIHQIGIMFVLIVIGFICYKVKLIDSKVSKSLSDILLLLVNPMVIFISYQREFDNKLFVGLLISFVLAILSFAVTMGVSYLLIHRSHSADVSVERMSAIYSNCGFMGIPLVNGLFGSEGVFYLTAYMTIFNILLWTHGLICMTGKADLKQLKKVMLSPCIITTIVGILAFMFRILVPKVLFEPIDRIASMNTPLAMLIAGVTIAQAEFSNLLIKWRLYFISFIRLVLCPSLLVILFHFLPVSEIVKMTCIVASACPAAASTTLFAIRYEKNALYASELFAITTILSLVTLPAVIAVGSLLKP